jgi:peptidoglycan/LPS O-acetylase OafA/YrhL
VIVDNPAITPRKLQGQVETRSDMDRMSNNLPTAADILNANKGVGPGFDGLRLLLSVWVFVVHSLFLITGIGSALEFAADPVHRIIISPVLPMFFAVSGYLVAGSAIRTKHLSTFLLFRVLRIAPALSVEVTLSALTLGPWLTETTLTNYFSDPLFFSYFLNIVGSPHMQLPGVFADNPVPNIVNANLWTLKSEFFCYLFMSVMIGTGVIFHKKYFAIVGVLVLCLVFAFAVLKGHPFYNGFGVPDWKTLIAAFMLGCLAFHWNEYIVVSHVYAILAGLIACGSLAFSTYSYSHLSAPNALVGLMALTYLVIYIGTRNLYLPNYLRNGDYSYGIYLFGFPLQQTLIHFLPLDYKHELTILLVGLPLTFAFAALSWNLVEKPTLKLKIRFKPAYRPASQPAPHLAV